MEEKQLRENDYIELRHYTDDDGADIIGRYIVLKHDPQRDLYIIQLREIKRVQGGDDEIPI